MPRGARNVGRPARRPDVSAVPFTPSGFPWPTETTAWHTTIGLSGIAATGFRARRQLGRDVQATGGGTDAAVSLTLSRPVADAILVGLLTLRAIEREELTLRALLRGLASEIPKAWNLMRAALAKEGKTQAILDRYADGWVLLRDQSTGYPLPDGAWAERTWTGANEVRYASTFWVRGEDVERVVAQGQRTRTGRQSYEKRLWVAETPKGVARAIYQLAIAFGEMERECYNPVFVGTNDALLAKTSLRDFGIVRVRANVERVCTDASGARALGYLDERDAGWAADLLSEGLHACERDLGDRVAGQGDSYWSTQPDPARKGYGRWPGKTTRQTLLGRYPVRWGTPRAPSRSMTYLSSMAELRVYDPSKLVIVDTEEAEEALRASSLIGRVTAPWVSMRGPFLDRRAIVRAQRALLGGPG